MQAGLLLRFLAVGKTRGPMHTRIHGLLRAAWKKKTITQESLARAMASVVGKYSQENAGAYLRGTKAGALDVDQADAALRHINSSLAEILAGASPPEPTRAQLAARRLEGRDELLTAVEALLDVPQQRLLVVLGQIDAGVFAATGRRLRPSGELASGTIRERRTTRGSKKRR